MGHRGRPRGSPRVTQVEETVLLCSKGSTQGDPVSKVKHCASAPVPISALLAPPNNNNVMMRCSSPGIPMLTADCYC